MERNMEFIRKLGEVLNGDNHLEIGTRERGNVIELPCFNEHAIDANNWMTNPFSEIQLIRILMSLMIFMEEVIPVNTEEPLCHFGTEKITLDKISPSCAI